MFNKRLVISLMTFLILMIFTSSIKNKTRALEKKINTLNNKIINLKINLRDAKTDYAYLSSPGQLQKYLSILNLKDYSIFDSSRIFLSTNEFIVNKNKKTKLIKDN